MFEKGQAPTMEMPKEKFPNVDAEASRILEQIDFNELKEVFSELIKDVGLDPRKNLVHFVDDENNFKAIDKSVGRAGTHPNEHKDKQNIILINWSRCRSISEEHELYVGGIEKKEQLRKQFLLKVVCHEEAHAAAFNDECAKKEGLFSGNITARSGYSAHKLNVKALLFSKKENLYIALNEAITELIGRQVFKEYIGKKNETANQGILMDIVGKSYWEEIEAFETILETICQECDVERDILWKVIMKGYFAGEDLSGEKMQRLFKNVFPESFEKKLSQWKDGKDEEISLMIKNCKWTDDDKKRVRRWILYVYHAMPNSQ